MSYETERMDALKNNSILIVDDAVKESVISEFRKNSKLVDSAFKGLRPTVTGLIAVAWFEIIKISIINVSKFLQTNNLLDVVINFKALIIFLVIFFLTKKFDKHPIVFIGIGALAGIVFKL